MKKIIYTFSRRQIKRLTKQNAKPNKHAKHIMCLYLCLCSYAKQKQKCNGKTKHSSAQLSSAQHTATWKFIHHTHSNECAMHTLNVINHIFTCLLKRFIVQRQRRWRRRWPLLRCWRTTVYIAITQSYCFKCVFECLCASMLQWIFSFYQSIFSSHTQQQTIAIRRFLTNTSATSVDTNEIIISRAYFLLGTNTTVFGWFM